MKVKTIILVTLACCTSGCITYSFGTQEELFNLSAIYYMDGRCEVRLPNRDREYVFKGMYYSESRNSPYRFASYSLVCSYDESGTQKKKSIFDPRVTVSLLSLEDDEAIEFVDDNHITLEHDISPRRRLIDAREHFRFIQRREDINISTRGGRKASVGVDKYFAMQTGANYTMEFRLEFSWHGHFARQLPGITRKRCAATLLSTDLSLKINSRDQARETGIYAEVNGTKGAIKENWCK